MLALRFARRELRGGVRGLRIVLACLALGVAVIGAVGTLRLATERGLAAAGRRLLGGALEIDSGAQPLPDTVIAWLTARGTRTSKILDLRTLLVAPSGERTLVELKAVDPAWPLVGTVETDPPRPVAQALAEQDGRFGLLTSQVVLDRLSLHPGDTARLGSANFTIRAALASEPDALATPALFGPHVVIPLAALPATGLVVPGSLVTYRLRIVLPPDLNPTDTTADLRAVFPTQGWRIRDPRAAAPAVAQFVRQTGLV